jgi:NAD(P)-dependent dehydrogenase (short-subunit alcohol dehydrogenase family)
MTEVTEERTVLITGGTGSLGFRTAAAIAGARQDWLVVITGRATERTRDAAVRVAERTGGQVVGLPLDLGSLAEVHRFAEQFPARDMPPLYAIVCNAGVQTVSGTVRTVDGFEQTFAVNHLAHFLLVRQLLPRLATPARIVLVSSDTHDPTKPTGMPAPAYPDARALAVPEEIGPHSAAVRGRRRYTTSKLCNVLMAYELARRLAAGDGSLGAAGETTVNAFDPGLMPGTGLARDYGRLASLAWRYLLPVLTVLPGLNVHTPRRSGAALARLVLDPALAGVRARYFSGTREVRSSIDSYDPVLAARLWDTSEQLIAEWLGG